MNTLFIKTATITGGDLQVVLLFKRFGGGGGAYKYAPFLG